MRYRLFPSLAVFAEEGLDVRERGRLDDNLVGVEDVVHVQVRDIRLNNALNVARALGDIFVRIFRNNVRLLRSTNTPRHQRLVERVRARRGNVAGDVVNNNHVASRRLQRGRHRQTTLLLVHLDGPIARLRSERHTPARLERRAGRTSARVTRPLLFKRLFTATANFALRQRARRTLRLSRFVSHRFAVAHHAHDPLVRAFVSPLWE